VPVVNWQNVTWLKFKGQAHGLERCSPGCRDG
jgi:hypothetical protein